MRDIKYIVVHCTATPQTTSIDSIKRYWREVMKWRDVGYHFIYQADGKEVQLLSIAHPSNGVKGHNHYSIHLSYIGGVDKFGKAVDNRTEAQKKKMLERIIALKKMFPKAMIQGHRDFDGVSKACPSFNAMEEYKHL